MFWNTYNIFSNFSHIIATKFCVSEDILVFFAYRSKIYVNYHIECINVLDYFEDGKVHYFFLYKDQNLFLKIDLCVV